MNLRPNWSNPPGGGLVDLASYADLAIDLVNTRDPDRGDLLQDLDGLRALLARRPDLGGRVGHRDLDTVRELREQLRAVFVAAGAGDQDEAIERLNALLIQHPIHPQLTRHDARSWHVHLNEAGSVPDRYAARAAMGLAVQVDEHGIERLGVCRAEDCGRVFFDGTANRSRRYCTDRCASTHTLKRLAMSEPVPSPRRSGEDKNGHGVPGRNGRPSEAGAEGRGRRHDGDGRPAGKTAARDGGQ
jgi:predicted RNA-binding Zn ribbon-like protein